MVKCVECANHKEEPAPYGACGVMKERKELSFPPDSECACALFKQKKAPP